MFIKMMAEVVVDKNLFDFHPKCSKLQITHMSFADDHLFLAVHLKSVKTIKDVLHSFVDLLGLYQSQQECCLLCRSYVDRKGKTSAIFADERGEAACSLLWCSS